MPKERGGGQVATFSYAFAVHSFFPSFDVNALNATPHCAPRAVPGRFYFSNVCRIIVRTYVHSQTRASYVHPYVLGGFAGRVRLPALYCGCIAFPVDRLAPEWYARAENGYREFAAPGHPFFARRFDQAARRNLADAFGETEKFMTEGGDDFRGKVDQFGTLANWTEIVIFPCFLYIVSLSRMCVRAISLF